MARFLAFLFGTSALAQTLTFTGPIDYRNLGDGFAVNAVGLVSSGPYINAASPTYGGGMLCDGVTDDTPALQAAVNAGDLNHSRKRVMIPGGVCMFTAFTVHAPVTVECPDQDATQLTLIQDGRNPSPGPMMTVAITSTDVPSAGQGFVYVNLMHCGLTSASRVGAGAGVAHAVYIHGLTSPTPATVVVNLIFDRIVAPPGDCVHYDQTGGGSWKGNIKAFGTTCESPGNNGVSCNSSTDWQWWSGQVWGALQNNFQFSGCSNMQIRDVNTFSAQLSDVSLFNSDMQWQGGVIDITGTDNVTVNNTGGQPVDINGALIRWPGQTTTNTYSNFRLQATNTGSLYCAACRILNPTTPLPGGQVPLRAVTFVAGNTGAMYVDGTSRVESHDWTDTVVSNNTDNIFHATGTATFPTTARIDSNNQFDGFVVRRLNGANWQPVAKIMGSSASNDSGALQLLNNNNVATNIIAFAQSQVSEPIAQQSQQVPPAASGSATVGCASDPIVLDGVNATFALTMCATPSDGQSLKLICGSAVTALTVNGNGAVMKGTATTCSVTQGHKWTYRASNTAWYMDY